MYREDVESLAQFVEEVSIYQGLTHYTFFRGQSVPGNLLPGMARKNPHLDTTEREKEMLRQFLRIGATRIPERHSSSWDQLILAQHFGMKTRLLDWSTNPLVAMFFACESRDQGDVYVYSLIADGLLMEDTSTDPFETERTWGVVPDLANDRIVAQHGCFTAHTYSNKDRKFVPLESNKNIKGLLKEYRIPESLRGSMLGQLDRCGINKATLFPDLEGLGRYLNWREENGELPVRRPRSP